jgi:hypothetical protein
MVAEGYGEGVESGEKSASVYSRDGSLYVAPVSKTEAGFGVESLPLVAIPLDADTASVGAAVRNALDASRLGIPTPSREELAAQKPSDNPRLRLAGVKSYRTFARGARHVAVTQQADGIRLDPSKTTEKGAFEYLPDRALIIENPCPSELADAIREALSRCEAFGER